MRQTGAILRRRALDVARRDTLKGSLSIKLKRAGWDDAFLLSLLNQLAENRPYAIALPGGGLSMKSDA